MCTGGSPSLPPVQTSEEAVEQRRKDETAAQQKARLAAAQATGRRSLINPTTGALGVVSNIGSTKSLF